MRLPTLRKGSKGPYVFTLKRILSGLGYYRGPIDENFDERTEKAVISFQRDMGIAVDGIVGRETWTTLFAQEEVLKKKRLEKYLLAGALAALGGMLLWRSLKI